MESNSFSTAVSRRSGVCAVALTSCLSDYIYDIKLSGKSRVSFVLDILLHFITIYYKAN